MSNYTAGLDLAQSSDWSALVIAEHLQEQRGTKETPAVDDEGFMVGYRTIAKLVDHFHVKHIERWRGSAYPVVIQRVTELLARPPLAQVTQLTVDATGVGRPVMDMLNDAYRAGVLAFWPKPVTITGSGEGPGTVPKASLVQGVEVLLQTGRLKIADGLPLAPALREELANFQAKVSATGHARYEAGGSGHDDLVLALALAVHGRPVLRGQPARMADGRAWSTMPPASLTTQRRR